MHPTTLALQEWAASATEKPVSVLNHLTDPMVSGGVSIWPWRVDEDRSFGHALPAQASSAVARGLAVSYLVFAPDLLTLERIREAIFQTPVRHVGTQQVTAMVQPLETSLLLKLFLACQVKPVPCLSLVVSAQPG